MYLACGVGRSSMPTVLITAARTAVTSESAENPIPIPHHRHVPLSTARRQPARGQSVGRTCAAAADDDDSYISSSVQRGSRGRIDRVRESQGRPAGRSVGRRPTFSASTRSDVGRGRIHPLRSIATSSLCSASQRRVNVQFGGGRVHVLSVRRATRSRRSPPTAAGPRR